MNFRTAGLIFVGVVAGAHVILFTDVPLIVRAGAALVIVGIGPGVLLAAWLLPRDDGGAQATLERIVISAALACTALTVGMLLLSYLPGGVARWQVLLGYDLAMAAMGIGVWALKKTGRQGEGEKGGEGDKETGRRGEEAIISNLQSPISLSWLLAGALVLLVIGAALRLPGLGYAEFHGDEARAVLRLSLIHI